MKFTNKKLLSKSSYSFVIRIISYLINYLFLFFIQKEFGIKAWGEFALYFAVFSFTVLLLNFGFNFLITKYCSFKNNVKYQIYKTTILLVSSLVILFQIIFLFLRKDLLYILPYHYNTIFTSFFLPAVLLGSVLQSNIGVLRGFGKVKQFTFYDSLGKFLLPLTILLLFFYIGNVKDAEYIIISFNLGLLLLCFFSFISISNFIKRSIKQKVNFKTFLTYANESKTYLMNDLLNKGLEWLPVFFLSVSSTMADIGLYDTLVRIGSIGSIFYYAISNSSIKEIGTLNLTFKLSDKQKIIDSVNNIYFYSAIVSFFLVPGVGIIVLIFLKILTTKALLILFIISIAFSYNLYTGSIGTYLQLNGFEKLWFKALLINFTVFVFSCAFLSNFYGGVGCALSVFISFITKKTLANHFYKQKTKSASLKLTKF